VDSNPPPPSRVDTSTIQIEVNRPAPPGIWPGHPPDARWQLLPRTANREPAAAPRPVAVGGTTTDGARCSVSQPELMIGTGCPDDDRDGLSRSQARCLQAQRFEPRCGATGPVRLQAFFGSDRRRSRGVHNAL